MATTADTPRAPRRGPGRRLATLLHGKPRTQLTALLALPMFWLIVVYLGSLAVLLFASLWSTDAFTGQVVHVYSLDNFKTIFDTPVYRNVTWHTVAIAACVTLFCALMALPMSFFMAKIASPRSRRLLIVAVLMPLWSSYIVKVYIWLAMLAGTGPVNWSLDFVGAKGPGYGWIAVFLVLSYLWLPYMILPVYTGFERIPNTLLEASSDLGGRSGITFRKVIFPLVFPAVVAGSIFTFSLSLGDYIVASELGTGNQMIGNVVFANSSPGTNVPLAAAFATVPVIIMIAYLSIARRLGAFDSL